MNIELMEYMLWVSLGLHILQGLWAAVITKRMDIQADWLSSHGARLERMETKS